MKQTIPFTKDITFKTKIKELTSISLDNDLTLKGEDLIVGNFYIKGSYKKSEEETEEYSYKVPCEIAISDDYDTFDCKIDIDDFHYEIINDEILRLNIVVLIDNLIKKEIKESKEERSIDIIEEPKIDTLNEESENKREVEPTINIIKDEKENIINLNNNEKYSTYRVYIVTEEDTIESIINKYQIDKEELSNYNDLTNICSGSKLIIPSISNDK